MHFKISKNELLKALNTVARAASFNTPLPSLCGIKFEAYDDQLILVASDSNISIKVTLTKDEENELVIYEDGICVIDSRYILDIVRKIDGKYINLEIMDGTLVKIEGGTSKFKLNSIPASDYPGISFNLSENKFKFKTTVFNEIVEQTAFACSDKETRPALTGVNLMIKDHKLYANATDSYRLASKTIELEEENVDFNITIPAKYLNEVYRSIVNEEEIAISIDNQKIAFLFENTIIQARLIEDLYPDTSRLVPLTFAQELEINSSDLLKAIDRSSFIKSDGKNVVKLAVENNSLTITSSSQEIGSSFETIDIISYIGNPIQISCSGKYLTDAVKALKSDKIVLKFNGELKPIIIMNKDNDLTLQLISPVRTYN